MVTRQRLGLAPCLGGHAMPRLPAAPDGAAPACRRLPDRWLSAAAACGSACWPGAQSRGSRHRSRCRRLAIFCERVSTRGGLAELRVVMRQFYQPAELVIRRLIGRMSRGRRPKCRCLVSIPRFIPGNDSLHGLLSPLVSLLQRGNLRHKHGRLQLAQRIGVVALLAEDLRTL